MNRTPSMYHPLSREQLLAMMQMQLPIVQSQQHPFPTGTSGVVSQPSNIWWLQRFSPSNNLMGPQTPPEMLQLLTQIREQQRLQHTSLDRYSISAPRSDVDHFLSGLNSGPDVVASNITAPVEEFSPADERLLGCMVQACEGRSIEDILQPLDGVNGHTTTQWVSYYVQNTKKIREIFNEMDATSQTVPSPNSPISLPRCTSKENTKRAQEPRENKKRNHPNSRSDRVTRSHLTRSGQVPLIRDTSFSIPPQTVITTGKFFTDNDIEYLKFTLTRALKRDSSALDSFDSICDNLGKGVSHHSAYSWKRYLQEHQELIDDVRREVGDTGKSNEDTVPQDEDDDVQTTQEPDGDEDECSTDDNISLSSSKGERELHVLDRAHLKSRGSRPAYIPSEQRALAKYIAKVTLHEWESSDRNWETFQRKHYSHSLSSWKKWYSFPGNKKKINRMVRRFEIRYAMRKSVGGVITTASSDPSQSMGLLGEASMAGPSTTQETHTENDEKICDSRFPSMIPSATIPELKETSLGGDAKLQRSPIPVASLYL